MSLANPGMLTEYEGPSRSSSRRSRGTVRVRDPAHGFFIAGSSLPNLNGIYGRVRNEHVQFLSGVGRHRPVRLAYRHDKTGWLMVLVDISPEERPDSEDEDYDVRYGFKEPCDMQWRFIDDSGLHRFRHKGDTIIPGAGIRWKHLPLPKPRKVSEKTKSDDYISSDSDSDSDDESDNGNVDQKKIAATGEDNTGRSNENGLEDVPLGNDSDQKEESGEGAIVAVDDAAEEFDEDELPWQVIALLDRSVLEDLRFSSACRDEKVNRALKGLDVQQPCQSTTVEGFLEAERRVLRSIESEVGSSAHGSGADNDSSIEDDVTPKGWLYRVTAEEGVELFTAPPDGIYVNESDEEKEGVVADVNMEDDSDDDFDENNSGEPRVVGMRRKDDYVRIIEQRGNWLCLARHEPPLRDVPLQVGDKVKVISGHYKGETGEIAEEASADTKEFGVNLNGYKGTGKLHATCMVRNGPHPLSRSAVLASRRKKANDALIRREERRRKREAREREREIMRSYYGDAYADYLPHYYDDHEEEMSSEESDGDDEEDDNDADVPDYDDGYKGRLWVQIAQEDEAVEPFLIRIAEHTVASLKIGNESSHAELYDKPFEPRLEDGSAHSASSNIDDANEVGEDEMDQDRSGVDHKPCASVLFSSGGTIQKAAPPPQCADAESFVIGLPVQLCGLNSHARYNGRLGVIITKANKHGRLGVRLDPSPNNSIEDCDKKLLLLPKNLAAMPKQSSALDISNHLTSEEQEHASRAARILNVRIDAIGLGNSEMQMSDGKKLLDSFLRSVERDAHPHRPRALNAAAQQLQSESLQEARKAHSALSIGIDKVAEARKGSFQTAVVGASPLASSPTAIIEVGLLGERAKVALALTADLNTFNHVEKCLEVLREVLKDEQARIFRARAEGGFVPSTILDWKLEQAEKDAAGDKTEAVESNDCLLIRLAMISVLFSSSRLPQATELTKEASEIYPHSGAVQLWRGRCLISEGVRIEGIEAINKCVTFGPHSGPGGSWAHREGVKRLRSLKRTLKCEIRARDSYERGKFKEAAKTYGEMMKEYDGYAKDDRWGKCEALVARAACHRRDRDLKAALADCDAALDLYPRYPRALFRRALCLLEDQRPADALAAFEQLLRVDRNWPNLLDWLIRATAQAKRQGSNGGTGGAGVFQGEAGDGVSENKDYYAVLGVSTDATEAQLKRAYRLMSLKVHPDKAGGSAAAFHQVAEAFETLSDPEKRQLYDDGVDTTKKRKKKEKGPYDSESSESEDEDGNKKKSLREEVERRYFPDHFQFWPFGDPFVNKRRHQQRKKKQAEQEKARKERMKARANLQPPTHPWWQGHSDWDL